MGDSNKKNKKKKRISQKKRRARRIKLFVIALSSVVVLGAIVLTVLGLTGVLSKTEKTEADHSPEPVFSEEDSSSENTAPAEPQEMVSANLTQEPELTPEEISANQIEDANAQAVEELKNYVPEDRIQVVEPANGDTATFTFAGDILFDRSYSIFSSYINRGSKIENCISSDLLDLMRNSDVMMVNNEFPYTDRGEPLAGKTYTFHAATSTVSVLDEMGVDIVSLANNHVFDYGEISLLDSMDTLDAAGMPFVGAGRNIEEATTPYCYVVNGYKIGILAATQIERYSNPSTKGATETSAGVFRCMDPTLLQEKITETKQFCDFVIVFIHWGTESTDVLDWAQTGQVEGYVDAGADLIIGGHPHVLQEVGYVKGVPVVYSLGNFWFNSKTLDSCVVTASIKDGKLESLQFVPCLQSGCSVKMLHDSEKKRVLNYMRYISGTAEIDENGYIYPEGSGIDIPITPVSRYVAPSPSPSADVTDANAADTVPDANATDSNAATAMTDSNAATATTDSNTTATDTAATDPAAN